MKILNLFITSKVPLVKKLSLAFTLFIQLSGLSAQAFSEAEFENLVLKANPELRALSLKAKALSDGVEESEAIYSWQLVGSVNKLWDKRRPIDPNFTYNSLENLGFNVGFQKQFSFGLTSKLSLNSTQTIINNGTTSVGTFSSSQWEAQPQVEFKLPLLGGGFGRKVRAEYSALQAQKEIEALQADSELSQKLNEAKTILWSTLLQRESIQDQKESLERLQKIFEIVKRKTERNLEATSNLLQTRSAVEQAQFDLESSRLKYNQLDRLLNLVLNQYKNIEVPAYDFQKHRKVELKDFQNLVTSNQKLLVKSSQLQISAAQVKKEEQISKLDVVASYGLSSRKNQLTESWSEVSRADQPTQSVGLVWTIPLDAGLSTRTRERQDLIIRANQLQSEYIVKEQRMAQIEDIIGQYNQNIDLLKMSLDLERTQLEKLRNERLLLGQGRSSIYQVLQFELDLSRSKSRKFALAIELENLKQQLSLYKHKKYE
jgi:outer membrane protein TolC